MEELDSRIFKWDKEQIKRRQRLLKRQMEHCNPLDSSNLNRFIRLISTIQIYDNILSQGFNITERTQPNERLDKQKETHPEKTFSLNNLIQYRRLLIRRRALFLKMFPDAKEYQNYFRIMANAARNNVTYVELNHPDYNLTNVELYKLALDFFKSLNYKPFILIIEEYFNNERLSLIDIGEDEGKSIFGANECFVDEINRLPYIKIARKNNTKDIYFMVHEIMHGIDQIMNPNEITDLNLVQIITNEVGSLFIEFILDDYLKQHERIPKESVLAWRQERLQYIDSISNIVYNELTVPNVDSRTIGKMLKASKDRTDISIDYMLSYFIALDLYLQYRKDKENGLNNLIKALHYNGDDLDELLYSIGINPISYLRLDHYRDHVEEIEQQLNTKLNSHILRK